MSSDIAAATGGEYHVIGSHTRYSSWTVRVVTLLDYYNIPYKASYFNSQVPEGKAQILPLSPSGLVPVLRVSPTFIINDSLAISEYLAETHPSLPLWPRDQQLRALARSAAAEMHSGFTTLRNTFGTNFIAHYTGAVPISDAAKKEVKRVLQIWDEARKVTRKRSEEIGEKDEGFLFGEFGIADAFFWPVLWRIRTYNLPLDTATPSALAWISKMWNDPTLQRLSKDYFLQAEDPVTKIDKYDDIFKGNPDVKYERFEEGWTFVPPGAEKV